MSAIDNIIAGINAETAATTTLAQRAVPYIQSNTRQFWGGECRSYDWVARRDREGRETLGAAYDARYGASRALHGDYGTLEI